MLCNLAYIYSTTWICGIWTLEKAVHGWRYEFVSATREHTDAHVMNTSQNDLAHWLIARVN